MCCIVADIRSLAHDNKVDLVEELLTLMAREQHAPEVWDHMTLKCENQRAASCQCVSGISI